MEVTSETGPNASSPAQKSAAIIRFFIFWFLSGVKRPFSLIIPQSAPPGNCFREKSRRKGKIPSGGFRLSKKGQSSGFIVGKSSTSRMDAESVSSMTSLSTPNPRPPVGGIPYSSAVTKS